MANPDANPPPDPRGGPDEVDREPPAEQPSRALLDAAPGPLHPRARDTLLAAVDAGWADPRRLYAEARTARRLLDQAREVISSGVGVSPEALSFTASGPDALRLAMAGLGHAGRRRGGRMVASAVEHSVILLRGRHAVAQHDDPSLLGSVPVDRFGAVDVDAFIRALDGPGTVLAALQHANPEVGTRQPVAAVHEAARRRGIPLVVDAQSSLGRDDPPEGGDVVVGDAGSFGGPGGVGLLVVRSGTPFALPGPRSEAEHGRAPDTPWVPLALAAAEAWQQTESDRVQDAAAAHDLVARLRRAAERVPDVEVVGDPRDRLPHVLTLSALYADGEALVVELDRRGLAVASGSACTSSTLEPSHVLVAMGALTHGSIRVTLPLRSVAADRAAWVERLVTAYPDAVASVRAQVGASGL